MPKGSRALIRGRFFVDAFFVGAFSWALPTPGRRLCLLHLRQGRFVKRPCTPKLLSFIIRLQPPSGFSMLAA